MATWNFSRAVLAALAAGLMARATAAGPRDVLAEGKGVRIERGEVDAEVQRLRAEATHRRQPIRDEQLPALQRQVLERLVVVRMFEARATPADRAQAEASARSFIDGLRQSQGPEGLARLLRQAGYTDATFRAAKVAEATVTAVIDREVRPTIRIPSADIREHYEKNASQWEQPEAVRVQNLLLSLKTADGQPLGAEALAARRQRMRELKAEAERGADFSDMVRRHSQDEASKARGGEYKLLRGLWPEELEKAAFGLEPGKVGGPVETSMGLHLLKLLERIPSRRLALDDVEEDIRKLLLEREVQQRIPEFIERIRTDLGVRRVAEP